jgi:hypothetical protein
MVGDIISMVGGIIPATGGFPPESANKTLEMTTNR